jgi:uncharacterized membrane protein
MNDFLNPKSMLTPGVAGSLMMFLVNGLASQFPELPARYLALFLSFLLGSIVWFAEVEGRARMVQKAVYWVLNSLLIFVIGFGTTHLAAEATAGPAPAGAPHVGVLFVPASACAATGDGAAVGSLPPPAQLRELQERLATEREENERLRRELEAATQCAPESTPPPPPPAPQGRKPTPQEQFFKRW